MGFFVTGISNEIGAILYLIKQTNEVYDENQINDGRRIAVRILYSL